MKYFAVVTNDVERDGLEIITWHRAKAGTIEHTNDVLKNDLAAGVLPSERFGANAAWFRLNVLVYKSWTQTVDADLAERTLARSRTEYTYPTPVSGTPSSMKTLSMPTKTLAATQAEAIAAFVLASGFIDLADAYGAPEGQRYYPYEITVHRAGGKAKHVMFRSNPSYEESPAAFKKLEAFLQGLPGTAGP